jgi:RNA polymerase sigma-70 factor, ECF subfamily
VSSDIEGQMTQTDQELLAQVTIRDSDAFEALFARYEAAVRCHLVGIVRDRDSAEDLLQEVFLRVWTHGEQWDGRGPFKVWLLRVATNFGLNQLRSMKRRREQTIEAPVETIADEDSQIPGWMYEAADSQPEMALELAERRGLVRRLVDDLPEEKREVIRLLFAAEMDTREVAERLGIPQGTVRSRLHHARKRLAREWKELETEWEE